eukprot:EC788249.1.p1 GENE.EC788249.1~~EC788249.1.p1  ORF type:complete len:161 (+),score=18.40 EC788249.1:30-512(+)
MSRSALSLALLVLFIASIPYCSAQPVDPVFRNQLVIANMCDNTNVPVFIAAANRYTDSHVAFCNQIRDSLTVLTPANKQALLQPLVATCAQIQAQAGSIKAVTSTIIPPSQFLQLSTGDNGEQEGCGAAEAPMYDGSESLLHTMQQRERERERDKEAISE